MDDEEKMYDHHGASGWTDSCRRMVKEQQLLQRGGSEGSSRGFCVLSRGLHVGRSVQTDVGVPLEPGLLFGMQRMKRQEFGCFTGRFRRGGLMTARPRSGGQRHIHRTV